MTAESATSASFTTARRVLLITGVVVVAANLRPALSAIGPVLDAVRADVGLSASAAGFIIGTLPLLTFTAVSPLVAPLARRIGTDQALWLGLIVLASGIVLRSLPIATLLWVGTVLLAAGISVGNVLLPSIVKRDFPDRIGPLTGLYSATAGFVAAVASGLAVPLANELPGGWRTALGIWAGLALIAAAVWAPQLARSARGPAETTVEARPVTVSPWRSLLAWEVAAFMALTSASFYTVISWYPTVLHHLGADDVTAGWLLFAYQVVGIPISLTVPVLLRHAAQRTVAALASLTCLIGYLGLIVHPDGAALWVVTTGIGAGAAFTLSLAFFSLRAADQLSAAALAGMGQAVAYLFAAAWPLLFGAVGDTTHEWTTSLWLLVALAVGQIVIAVRMGGDSQFRA